MVWRTAAAPSVQVNTSGSLTYASGYWAKVGDSTSVEYNSGSPPTSAWGTGTITGGSFVNDVVYGNGYWVCVGGAPGVANLWYKATDPTGSWTTNTQGTAALTGLIYGNGYWVTFTQSTGIVRYRATDPTGAFTTGTTLSIVPRAAHYANDYWVVVGDSGALKYKTGADPSGSWTSNAQGSDQLTDVVYGNNYWVATDAGGEIWYKAGTDPTGAWTQNTLGGTEAAFNSVAYASTPYGDLFCAVGNSGQVYVTTDPSGTWSSEPDSLIASTNLYQVAYGNGYWVTTGPPGTAWYGNDPKRVDHAAAETIRTSVARSVT